MIETLQIVNVLLSAGAIVLLLRYEHRLTKVETTLEVLAKKAGIA